MTHRKISGFEDFSEDPYQLSIIVKDTKDFTTLELVSSIATSVADFAPVQQEAHNRGEHWEQWLSGRFRKIVKRLKPSLYNKFVSQLHESNFEYFISSGKVELIILAPQRKSFVLPSLKRAQLSGLTVIKAPLPNHSQNSTIVIINNHTDMSVSKMAVSAAHALQMTKQFIYDSDSHRFSQWSPSQTDFIWKDLDNENEYTIDVVDAGLTEVEHGTRTAAAIIQL